MATYNSYAIANQVRAGGSGNRCVAEGAITGNGSGGTAAAGSVINLLKLPAFSRVYGIKLIVGAATTSLTGKVGYLPVDGSSGDDAALIAASTDLSAAGSVVDNTPTKVPFTLTKDSYIALTTAGATLAATTKVTALVDYEYLGPT